MVFALSLPVSLYAVPSSKQSQLRSLKNQVDTINDKIEVVNEEYLEAKIKLNKTVRKINQNAIALEKNQTKLNFSRHVLSKRVRTIYKNGSQNSFDYVFETKSFNELITNIDYIARIGQSDSKLIKNVVKLVHEIEQAKKSLSQNMRAQKSIVNSIGRKKQSINSEIKRKKTLISGLEADLAAYARAQEQREMERAARQRQAVIPEIVNRELAPPPSNAPRSSVVEIAMRYLGRPYQWAAAGPDRFDCSGLTMYVYAQVGISLPHSSRAQSGMGQYVGRNQLQPGDLLFSGNPIHHVGIYIGGGRMISAPQTGDVVKISPIRRNFRWGRRI